LQISPLGPGPAFAIDQTTMTFAAIQYDPSPPEQQIQLGNGGDGGSTLTWWTHSDSDWLAVSPASGTTTGEVDTLTVTVDTSDMDPGTYSGLIAICDPAAANNPKTVRVDLTVDPAGVFTKIDTGLVQLMATGSAWGDFDGDGDLDLVTTGCTSWDVSARRSILYRNNGDGTLSAHSEAPTKIAESYASWGDLENDGDIDLAIMGSNGLHMYNDCISQVWQGDGLGGFTYSGNSFGSAREGAIVWLDYDNDGLQDLYVTGESAFDVFSAKLYHNIGGSFVDSGATLPAWAPSFPAVGDYDGDGDMDLVAHSSDSQVVVCRNMGGGIFSQVATLNSNFQRASTFVDVDGDGDLDLSAGGRLYVNEGGTFTQEGSVSLSEGKASAWGDFDNDGDVDVVTNTFLRVNDGSGQFSSIATPLFQGSEGEIVCGDYDGDGDLDLAVLGAPTNQPFAAVYRNNCTTANTPPSPPGGLGSSVAGSDVTFSWSAAADDHTPASGLTYNIRVGTTKGVGNVVSGMARLDGRRLVPARGNADKRLSWKIKNLSPGTYYWSVQAIDTAFLGSAWAEDAVLHLNPVGSPPTVATPASASPDSVDGTQTTLSVLGADDGGEASLIYVWALLEPPPAPVAVSDNLTNTAKTCTATFSAAGEYSLAVIIFDGDGLSVVSEVTVTVNPVVTVVTVSPATTDIEFGAEEQFTALVTDQFGDEMTATVSWSVGGSEGTIDANGLFTAGTTAGGPNTVTGTAAGVDGTAQASVHVPDVPVVTGLSFAPGVVMISSPASIEATFNVAIDPATATGDSVVLEAAGGDGTFGDGNEVLVTAATVAMTYSNVVEVDLSSATLPADTYRLTISGGGSYVVANYAGDALDGEWTGAYPSGNATPGGDFQVTFILC
jgi:hypothetical protein